MASPDAAAAAHAAVVAAYEKTLASERHLRQLAEQALAAARSSSLQERGYPTFPIGTVESPLRSKRGAPRQGALAPSVRARVRLSPALDPAALEGLAHYSHVWLLYLFHDDEARDAAPAPRAAAPEAPPWVAAGRCGAATICAPGLHGGRTGVLSTRSPHRPNSIGLTLCALEGVGEGGRVLRLAGCDAIHGTPVFDVKPYIHRADCPPGAPEGVRAPQWVAAPLAPGAAPPLAVQWAAPALQAACRAAAEGGRCDFYGPGQGGALVAALEEVLALDTRSVHQGRGSGAGGGHVTALAGALAAAAAAAAGEAGGDAAAAAAPAAAAPDYLLHFDSLRLAFRYGSGATVVVTAVEVVGGGGGGGGGSAGAS